MSIERRKKYHKYAKKSIIIHYVFDSIDKVLYNQKIWPFLGQWLDKLQIFSILLNCLRVCNFRQRRVNMQKEVMVALISLAGTIAGSFGGVLASSKLTAYRLRLLENKVDKHNRLRSGCRWWRKIRMSSTIGWRTWSTPRRLNLCVQSKAGCLPGRGG